MVLPHPCSWIPERVRPRFFAVALLLTLAVLVALQRLGAPLRTAAATSGIVSFELAGTLSAAQEILRSWGVQGEKNAGINLGLDYLFLFAYAASIGLACILVADKFRGDSPIRVVGVLLSWALIVAATLDGIENYALISLLLGSINAALPALARSAALVKFALVFLGLLYVVLAGVPRSSSFQEATADEIRGHYSAHCRLCCACQPGPRSPSRSSG
jgi:hypothetical protein